MRPAVAAAGLVFGVALWLLVPSYYYFRLPDDERNNPEKLQAVLPGWAPGNKTKLNLGLDLQGGIHLVLGVDADAAGAFHTVDGVLYSYNLPLCKLNDEGMAVALPGLEEKHSTTTSGHQTYARLAVKSPGYF